MSQSQQQAEPTSTQEQDTSSAWNNYVFIGVRGYVLALNPNDEYKQVWKTELKIGSLSNQTRFLIKKT